MRRNCEVDAKNRVPGLVESGTRTTPRGRRSRWWRRPRDFRCRLLALCVALLPAAALGQDESSGPAPGGDSATAEAPATDFLRFVPGTRPGEGRLETSVVRYRNADGIIVDLIGAVHVADARYYRALQDRFEAYDALLYEMVKPTDAAVEPSRTNSLIGMFQRALKDVLELEFQLDGIDYETDNFVHADLDLETFQRLQKERGESIFTLMFAAMRAELERQKRGERSSEATVIELLAAFFRKDSASALKLLFAREMENMENVLAGVEDSLAGDGEEDEDGDEDGDGEKGSVIVAERNKVALRVLARVVADGKTKVGIFYGAAHMLDFEKSLTGDLGYRKVREEWLTAWDIRSALADGGERPEEDGEKDGEPVERDAENGDGKGEESGKT